MMSSTLIALLCIRFAPATAMLRGTGHESSGSKIHSDMRPEVVSELLSNVQKKWIQGRMMVLRNVTDEASSYSTMEGSCLKLTSAIVAGSEGEKDRVVEYMQDVCGSGASKNSPSMCLEFASGVEGAMTDDEGFNRDQLNLKPFCKKFWEHSIAAAAQAEKQQLDAEEAKKEEEAKREEEEAKKREEEEAKKVAEKAAEEAKEEQAKKDAEEVAEKQAKEEQAKEAAEAKAQEKASKAVEQNTTVAEAQIQNTTSGEAQPDAQPVVEVTTTNATSAVAVESAPTEAAPQNASKPVDAAPSEVVSNSTATETKAAVGTNVTVETTETSKAAPAKATAETSKA